MRPTLFVMLGRAGDVINLLPVLRDFRETTGETPLLLVGKEFASILDGVSYATPLVWPGPWQDCVAAVKWARTVMPLAAIVDASIYGIGFHPVTHSASFDREAWDRAGAERPWGRLPLVFDRRDREREEALVRNVLDVNGVPRDGPFVLASFSGCSSPFAAAPTVLAALLRSGLRVVDVSDVRAGRIYDLLALFERAAVLVASDSAPLHLAHAVPSLPVVMLTQDAKPRWHRSSWRPQHAARIFYSEATIDPSRVARAVEEAIARAPRRKFMHVQALNCAADSETLRRTSIARASWREEQLWAGGWSELLVPESELPRSATKFGDPHRCPFYRDLIEAAVSRLDYRDVVVVSNADVGISPGFTGWLVEELLRSEAVYTHRWDRHHRVSRPLISEAEVSAGRWYPGSDCWAFTRAWWEAWGDRFPDMILGREAGDLILRHVVKQGGGVEIPSAVWHERHASFWESSGNRNALGGNLHNRVLATKFLREFGGSWNDGVEVSAGLR